ncbi:MAG: glycosyl transferase family protein [Parcubacteria group bacterium Gr01-1014_44]|nr:MAG: glycosyl transferase family protein [Parcubacteria group bacterium Gr01-1014_44]
MKIIRIMKLSVIIPVYNEKRTLLELLARVEKVEIEGISEKEIVLVDDFSTDGTREILHGLSRPHYKVVFHDKNLGKGAAVRTGFSQASGDIFLIQDADLEYDPQDYPVLLRPILDGRADVVYGSRFLATLRPGSGQAVRNRVVYRHGYLFSRVLNWLSNILSGVPLSDMYTCYKVFSREAVQQISPHLRSKRFGIDPELTAWVGKFKFKIMEVPISYQGRTYAEGKKINWKDGLAAIWHIIKFNLFT